MAEPSAAPAAPGDAADQMRSKLAARRDLLEGVTEGSAEQSGELPADATPAQPVAAQPVVAQPAPAQPAPELDLLGDNGDANVAETNPKPPESAPAGHDEAGPKVFDLSMDSCESPAGGVESLSSTTAGTADWYSLDEEQANETLQQKSLDDQEPVPQVDGDKAKPQMGIWASKLSKKAGKFANAAKTAIQAEAKLVAADAKDLALGVREGAQITIQDTKSLSKQLSKDAKSLASAAGGWRGLWRGKKDQEPVVSTEVAGATASVSSSGSIATQSGGSRAPAPALPPDDVSTEGQPEPPSGSPQGAPSPEVSQASTATASAAPATGRRPSLDGSSANAPAALQAIKQSWAATAEVSMGMWRDIKEANKEAMQDLKSGVQELRQGVQQLRQVSAKQAPGGGVAEGPVGSSDNAVLEAVASEPTETAEVSGEGPRETEQANPSLTEALDMLLSTTSEIIETEETSPPNGLPRRNSGTSADIFDPRSSAEKAFDEQAARVAQAVEEVARGTAAASTKVWRKMEQGIKKSLGPQISRGNSSGGAFPAPGDGEDGRPFEDFKAMPSTRANYVELAAADFAQSPVPEVVSSGDLHAAATPSANKAVGAAHAARRARKLGGKLAKRSREVSGNLLKQVQAGAVASAAAARSAVAGAVPSTSDASVNNIGDNASEDDVFEIGSEDEELFPGDSGDGSEIDVSEMLNDEEEEEVFRAPVDAPAAASASVPTPAVVAPAPAGAATVAAAAVPAAPVATAPPPAPSAPSSAPALAAAVAPVAVQGVQAAAQPPAPAPKALPVQTADLLGGDHSAPVAAAAPAAPPASSSAEDALADLLEIPDDFLMVDSAPAAPPAPAASLAPQPVKAAPAAPPAPPPPPAAVAPASQPSGAKLDFLAAAEKELEDLFGDDD